MRTYQKTFYEWNTNCNNFIDCTALVFLEKNKSNQSNAWAMMENRIYVKYEKEEQTKCKKTKNIFTKKLTNLGNVWITSFVKKPSNK